MMKYIIDNGKSFTCKNGSPFSGFGTDSYLLKKCANPHPNMSEPINIFQNLNAPCEYKYFIEVDFDGEKALLFSNSIEKIKLSYVDCIDSENTEPATDVAKSKKKPRVFEVASTVYSWLKKQSKYTLDLLPHEWLSSIKKNNSSPLNWLQVWHFTLSRVRKKQVYQKNKMFSSEKIYSLKPGIFSNPVV